MKKILLTLLLPGIWAGIHAQGTNDPFFDAGYAGSVNAHIIGGPQTPPALVNNVIADMRTGNASMAALVAQLKNQYGYAVWDRSSVFTAHGRETALIPMVRANENSINGVLIAVRDGGELRYGIMDLEHLFPYASADALNEPGIPGARMVLTSFAYFNHRLFGTVNCNIVSALYALSPHNARNTAAGQPKNCFFNLQEVQNCWHIYGIIEGAQVHLYTECTSTYNWIITCLPPSSGWPTGFPGIGGGNGGNGGGTEITDLEEGNCAGLEVHNCSYSQTLSVHTTTLYGATCNVVLRLSGCRFENCDVYLQSVGIAGCGFRFGIGSGGGISISLDFIISLQNVYSTSYLTSVISYDPLCNVTTRCGAARVEYDVVSTTLGIPITIEHATASLNNVCYTCRNCPA